MINKTLTYTQQMAEVNAEVSKTYAAKTAAPHKGGTVPMKTLLTRWGVEGSLYVGMTTHSIYKCIALGKVRCIAGFARKEILADGYGNAQDVQWLMETTPVRPAAIPATESTIIRFSPDEEEDYGQDVDGDGSTSSMFLKSIYEGHSKPNAIYGQTIETLSTEQGNLLMNLGVEAIKFNGYGGSPRWSMAQASAEIGKIKQAKRSATAAKSAATKAAKKAGNK